jgi:hypothetical protein
MLAGMQMSKSRVRTLQDGLADAGVRDDCWGVHMHGAGGGPSGPHDGHTR